MIGCQSASGIWFLIAYQTYFLLQGGVSKAFEYTIMTSCIGFIGVNVGMFSMQHLFGRRNILMIGAMGCCLCQLAPAIAASTSENLTFRANILTAFIALFKFFYNGGVGVASYAVATEVVSTRLRAWTVGSATAIGYLLAWLVSFCSPYFINPAELGLVSLNGSPRALLKMLIRDREPNTATSGPAQTLPASSGSFSLCQK